MIYLLTLMEMLVVFIYHNILFNNNFKRNLGIKLVLSAILATIFYYLPESNSAGTRICIFLVKGIITAVIDKKEIFITIMGVGLASMLMMLSELVAGAVMFVIVDGAQSEDFILFLVLGVAFFIGTILINYLKNKANINIEKYLNNNRLLCILIINILVFCLFLLIANDGVVYSSKIYVEYAILGLALILANSYCYKNLYKDLQIKRELEINLQYQYVIEELLDKFRANEHEYKNHLNTLNAMVTFSDDKELKKNINNYIFNIKEQTTYSKLMYIKSTILKAILYNKISICEEKNIKFNYEIICNFDEAPLDNTEQSVLLNNLLNNAIEAVELLPEKFIKLKVIQGVRYEVVVENNLASDVVINQDMMFKKGISSKGEGRGFGLYNIKKIVEKYKGTIQLSVNDGVVKIKIII